MAERVPRSVVRARRLAAVLFLLVLSGVIILIGAFVWWYFAPVR
jgi:hypothetical protein